ncbi:hypothetical protein Leryth_017621 [Lithospermum erythrorhizon]|nr:hypothetical protein Leryth_017621 [Lithospermum erythrorhizon]
MMNIIFELLCATFFLRGRMRMKNLKTIVFAFNDEKIHFLFPPTWPHLPPHTQELFPSSHPFWQCTQIIWNKAIWLSSPHCQLMD